MNISVSEIALLTNDAHSHDRYGKRGWLLVVKGLEERGYTLLEIVAILRSSWMRHMGNYTAKTFLDAIDVERNKPGLNHQRQVDDLVKGTFRG